MKREEVLNSVINCFNNECNCEIIEKRNSIFQIFAKENLRLDKDCNNRIILIITENIGYLGNDFKITIEHGEINYKMPSSIDGIKINDITKFGLYFANIENKINNCLEEISKISF